MVRERFNKSFDKMRDQSNRLANTDRSTENFDEIVEQRVELDRLRHEVTDARKDIVSRYEPPAPKVVESHSGYVHTKLIGKIGAAAGVLLLAGAVVAGLLLIRDANNSLISIDNVTESIDAECVWRVEATVLNQSDKQVTVERVDAIIEREFTSGLQGFLPTIPAGEAAPLIVEWKLRSRDGCPAVEDIDHGNIRLFLDDGSLISEGL